MQVLLEFSANVLTISRKQLFSEWSRWPPQGLPRSREYWILTSTLQCTQCPDIAPAHLCNLPSKCPSVNSCRYIKSKLINPNLALGMFQRCFFLVDSGTEVVFLPMGFSLLNNAAWPHDLPSHWAGFRLSYPDRPLTVGCSLDPWSFEAPPLLDVPWSSVLGSFLGLFPCA